ncbi:MAG: TlpA disulfide reductase family protein [Bacteroidota bacterium]
MPHCFPSRLLMMIAGILIHFSISSAQSVHAIDAHGFDSLRTNRNGRVLVLNIWATWCAPCKEEFPDLITLAKDFKMMNIDFAAISVDFPDEVNSKILPFLTPLAVPFPVFVSDFPSAEQFINTVDQSWSGAIPATIIYSPEGTQKVFLKGKQNYAQFKKAVEDVLTKP